MTGAAGYPAAPAVGWPFADRLEQVRAEPGLPLQQAINRSAFLAGGPGPDLIRGGLVSYSAHPQAVWVTLDGAANDGSPGEKDNVLSAVWLEGTAFADDLTGSTGGERIDGLGGNDRVSGGAGDDVVSGDEGADRVDGGNGSDWIVDGAGADHLRARDGAADTVACVEDEDRDITVLDSMDNLSQYASDCEHVTVS